MLLVMDCYSCDVQLPVLMMLKKNNIYVVGLPAHTSHVLQPLDVSVYSPFKSFLQCEIHARARTSRVLDAFDVAEIISVAYSEAFTVGNIRSGFFEDRDMGLQFIAT